jgi:hypothetical protein
MDARTPSELFRCCPNVLTILPYKNLLGQNVDGAFGASRRGQNYNSRRMAKSSVKSRRPSFFFHMYPLSKVAELGNKHTTKKEL